METKLTVEKKCYFHYLPAVLSSDYWIKTHAHAFVICWQSSTLGECQVDMKYSAYDNPTYNSFFGIPDVMCGLIISSDDENWEVALE